MSPAILATWVALAALGYAMLTSAAWPWGLLSFWWAALGVRHREAFLVARIPYDAHPWTFVGITLGWVVIGLSLVATDLWR